MEGETSSPPTYRVFRDQHGIPQFSPKRGTQALKDALIYAFPTLETELQLMQAALRHFFDSERTQLQFVCELPENNLQASLAKKRDVPVSPREPTNGVASLRNWKVPATPSRPTSRPSSRASSRGRSRASSRAPSRAETPAQSVVLEPLVEVSTGGGGIMTTWQVSNGLELEKRKRQPYDPVKRRKVAENRGNACAKHRASKTTCDPDECPLNKLSSKPAQESGKGSGKLRGRVSNTSLSGAKFTSNTCTLDGNVQPGLDATRQDLSQASHTPSVAGSEVFWDAFEQEPSDTQAESSILSFADIASNSDSGYWTDNDPAPWIPRSNYPTFPGSSLEGSLFPGVENSAQAEIFAQQEARFQVSNTIPGATGDKPIADAQGGLQELSVHSDEPLHPTYTPLQIESPDVISTESSASKSGEALMSSQDPYMGSWASEKAHHLFDDYGWVLNHVENL